MSYAKLFGTITESSLWGASKDARILFVSLLAKADSTGFIEAALPGLARMANLTLAETEAALADLMAPDKYSKSTAHEGRRVVEVERGWCLVNYEAYRERRNDEERREYMREYMKKYRETPVNSSKQSVNSSKHSVNSSKHSVNKSKPCKPPLAQAETETSKEETTTKNNSIRNSSASARTHAEAAADADADDIFQTAKTVMDNDKATLAKSQSQEVVYSWQDWRTEHPRIRIERVGEGNMDDWRHLWKKYGREIMDIMYDRLVKALESGKVIWFNGANTWLNENTSED